MSWGWKILEGYGACLAIVLALHVAWLAIKPRWLRRLRDEYRRTGVCRHRHIRIVAQTGTPGIITLTVGDCEVCGRAFLVNPRHPSRDPHPL